MWLIYVSYLVLRRFSSGGQTPVLAAALAVFGALDVPLVYFSIWFFRTQHPQPVIGGGGSIDPRMLHVLLINWAAFFCFALLVCWSRYHLEVLAAGSGRDTGAGSAARTWGIANWDFAKRKFAMSYLHAAYAATWVIHIAYLGTLLRRYTRLRSEVEELKQK